MNIHFLRELHVCLFFQYIMWQNDVQNRMDVLMQIVSY